MKKSLLAILLVMMLGLLCACGSTETSNTTSDKKSDDQDVEQVQDDANTDDQAEPAGQTASDGSKMDMTGVAEANVPEGFSQTAAPVAGETIATMSIEGYGDVKIRLFDEVAPYGVKNFVEHAKAGYYDGLTFHRVISDFMIQGGDPEGTGMGGESIWGTPFYNEVSDKIGVIRGSLCYANSGMDPSNGSQFFITQMKEVSADDLAALEQQGLTLPEETKKIYTENGGCPWLQGGYTVFGQVYEGMDFVDQISAVETDESDKPKTDVIISKVTISQYGAE